MNNTEKKLDALIDALGFDVDSEPCEFNNILIIEWYNQWQAIEKAGVRFMPPDKPTLKVKYKFTKRDELVEDEHPVNLLAEIFGKHSHVNPSTLLKLQIIGILKRANKQPKKDAIMLINHAIDEAFKNE